MTLRVGPRAPSAEARGESPTRSVLRVGLLVNPIAGLGGEAGLKGSDHDWRTALERGFTPHAHDRARRFVAAVAPDARVSWLCPPGVLGLDDLPRLPGDGGAFGQTTPDDTRAAAVALREAGVDLLCFVGGDGTAADVSAAVDGSLPCLGVPAGVKITSPVFAHDPEEAAWLVSDLAPGFESIPRDVTDLDEGAYRAGRVEVTLLGSLRVPASPVVQGGKVPTTGDTPLEPLVEQCLRDWDPDALHLVGAGSVCRALKANFWGTPTLLGVDAVRGDRIVATDLDGRAAERLVAEHPGPVHLWLSLIGGQGMLLGRGTQVLTPPVLRRAGWEHLHVLAPPEKLLGLRGVHVDSGDPGFDASAPRYVRVVSGYNETRLVRVLHGAPAPTPASAPA